MINKYLKKQLNADRISSEIELLNSKLDSIKEAITDKTALIELISEEATKHSRKDKETGFAVITLLELDIILCKLLAANDTPKQGITQTN